MRSIDAVFPALSEPSVRRYLTGQVVSVLGAWTQSITLNLLLWQMTRDASLLGALNFLLYGPVLVLGPFVGSRIGPRNARRSVLTVLIGSIAIALALLGLLALDALTPVVLLVAAGGLGVLTAMEMPGRQVLLTSSLADRRLLNSAVAMNAMAYNVGRMTGPAIAALVFARVGPAGGFVCSACALSFMAWCVRGIHPRQELAGKSAGGIRAAFAFARTQAFARLYLPVLIGLAIFAGSYQTLIPVLADHEFHHVSHYTGLFFSCAGGGSLCAALLLSSKAAAPLVARGLRWTPLVCGAALGIVALAAHPLPAGIGFWLLGLSLTFTATSINVGLQSRSPDELRGGIIGLYGTAFVGMVPIGHLIAGSLSERLGVRQTLGLNAVLLSAWIGWLLWRQSRSADPEDED
ncbi:MAG: MFS transporter [Burkholderiaceae bacterium]